MAIFQPEIRLSNAERELLRLLSELLVTAPSGAGSNLPPDQAVLSENEACLLLELLEQLAVSRGFVEGAYFVEKITDPEAGLDDRLREIYLSHRKRNGRSRAMASTHWANFLFRLGVLHRRYGYVRGLTNSATEMSYEHFRKMEIVLLSQPGVSPRVRALILTVIDKYQTDVELARSGQNPLPDGAISDLPNQIIAYLKDDRNTLGLNRSVPAAQVAGLMTALVDTSVLFSTRDWGVAGTLSTIAGGFAAAAYK